MKNLFILLFLLAYGHCWAQKPVDYKKKINQLQLNRKQYSFEENLVRFDSAIYLAKLTADNLLIGDTYVGRASLYFGVKNYVKAFDNFIIAKRYIDQTDDDYQKNTIRYGIAVTLYQLGDYNKAKELLLKSLAYFELNHQTEGQKLGLLGVLHRLGYISLIQNDLPKAKAYNKEEFRRVADFKDSLSFYYAKKNQGVYLYKTKDYTHSIQSLTEALPGILENKDYLWTMICYFYLGENYQALNNKKEALVYYTKVDALFSQTEIVTPELRSAFERIVFYAKKENNSEEQLRAINQLLKFDSLNTSVNQEVTRKYYEHYQTRELIQEKEKLEKEMIEKKKERRKLSSFFIFLFFSSLLTTIFYVRQRERKQKKNFNLFLKNESSKIKPQKEPVSINMLEEEANKEEFELDLKTFDTILARLKKQEDNHFYTNKETSLKNLADLLNTNTKYLSLVINRTTGKSFPNYINELRLDYIIRQIIENPKVKNYSIEGLAELGGFKSRQKLSDSFLVYTGVRPSYFLKNIGEIDHTLFSFLK